MVAQKRLIHTLLIFILSFNAYIAIAQPTLPDIAGAADKGIVILSWNCQYSGVKSITVLHSTDSTFNYSIIGKVKKLSKGLQAFVDGHPAAGMNYYKLSVLFTSGLSWGSNRCSVMVDKTTIGASGRLPANDSIQRYLATSDTMKAGQMSTITETPLPPKKPKSFLDVQPEDSGDDQDTAKQPGQNDNNDSDMAAPTKPAQPKRKVYISFDIDTPATTAKPGMPQAAAPFATEALHHKIIISFQEPDANTPSFIRSQYIYTDPVSGHIRMDLPGDVATHHYSVKFYNDRNEVIVEVPHITASKIIIDRRNFQRAGIYRFVLRRDVVELEAGYVEVKM